LPTAEVWLPRDKKAACQPHPPGTGFLDAEAGPPKYAARGKSERLRDAPAEWSQQFEALGLNPQ